MNNFFPAEWHQQDAVQLTWPHKNTDWNYMLPEAIKCFAEIGKAIASKQNLIIVAPLNEDIMQFFPAELQKNIHVANIKSNDTWARDHGAITLFQDGEFAVADFKFNGWGNKFNAQLDTQITRQLYNLGFFTGRKLDYNDFVFEGGAIESDGKGTLLTTESCLLNPNRNPELGKKEIESILLKRLHSKRILWLKNGYLAGDDTDAHIDTLARFSDEKTIVYVQCLDKTDEHYEALKAMEDELKAFKTLDGKPYQLIALPHPKAVFNEDGDRLPATYANFLIINDAVLAPIYGQDSDEAAINALKKAFPKREIIPIDCTALIQQNGSLHCVTMQYPKGILDLE